MQYVLVNGVPVIDGGKSTDALPGKVLRGPGYRRGDRD
jgi:N-acyl-D-amino-acid deacylase